MSRLAGRCEINVHSRGLDGASLAAVADANWPRTVWSSFPTLSPKRKGGSGKLPESPIVLAFAALAQDWKHCHMDETISLLRQCGQQSMLETSAWLRLWDTEQTAVWLAVEAAPPRLQHYSVDLGGGLQVGYCDTEGKTKWNRVQITKDEGGAVSSSSSIAWDFSHCCCFC